MKKKLFWKAMTIVAVVAFVVVAIIGPYKDYATAYEFTTTNLVL